MLALLLASCQVIPEADRLQYVGEVDTTSLRHILLVELTGWSCPNCPDGATIAHKLQQSYPSNLVVVEIHPSVSDFTAGSTYTSAAGDAYFKSWGGTSTNPLFPSGVINFTSGFLDRTKWTTSIADLLSDMTPMKDSLQLDVSADSQTHKVTVSAHMNPLMRGQLLLWLVEDGIVGMQAKGSEVLYDYVHNHVLRGSLYTNPWGEVSESGQFAIVTYEVNESYAWQNCSVVGVLLNPDSKELIDVIQIKLPK